MPDCRHSAVLLSLGFLIGGVACGGEPDARRGETLFTACLACHNAAPAAVGPALTQIMNRKAGMAAGFRYSNAMRNSMLVWTEATLKDFITDPQALIPGNRMAFSGMADPQDVIDLVAYIKGF